MEHSSRSSSFILYSITILIISCGFFQSSYAVQPCYSKSMTYADSQGKRITEYYTSCNHGSGPAPHTGGDPPSPSHPHGPIVPPAPILRPRPLFPSPPLFRPSPLFPPTPILRPRPLFPSPPVFRPGPNFPPPAPAFPGGN